ncbi:MAG: sulfatase-like hydrolase/transferase [Solirubrobacterales bacterium]|nr:sulfatase-like hydrolase/transferase [Solirubrobacterales bacterium]
MGAGPASAPQDAAAAAQARPNVIVVLTDDESVAELTERTMPETLEALSEDGNGTEFTASIVSSPLCCPSRAGSISGQYPHNDGVFDNEPGYPGLADKGSTIYSWLQAAGYRTGHLGRWLLNYDAPAPPGEDYDTDGGLAAPPGIDHWFGYVGSQTLYQGATLSRNGTPVTLGGGLRGYTTRAINREALGFVRAAKSDPRPFFLTVAQIAPHAGGAVPPAGGYCGRGGLPVPERGKIGKWRTEPLPKPPNFDESKLGDKPDWVQTRPGLGAQRRHFLRLGWRCALATLGSVDRGVGQLVEQLERQGELDNTAVFFTSDNGYLFGEHRVVLNKVYPYEESLRVPLLARVPERLLGRGVRREGRPAAVEYPVNNLDLTATILDLAGAPPCTAAGACRVLDGRSLMPLLSGKRPDWARQRTLLFQIGSQRQCGALPGRGMRNFYDGIRTRRHVYVELDRVNPDTGQCDRPEYELYDLKRDPYQLRNRAVNPALATPSPLQASLAQRLAVMRQCSGIAGRDPASARPFCE